MNFDICHNLVWWTTPLSNLWIWIAIIQTSSTWTNLSRGKLSGGFSSFQNWIIGKYGQLVRVWGAGLYKIISWLRPLLLNQPYSCVNQGWYIIEINFLLHFHLRTFWPYSDRRSRGRGFCTALVTAIIEEIISTIIKSTQTQSTPTITQMQITPTNTLTHCTPTNTQTQNTPTNTQTESTPTNTQTQSTPTKTQTQSTLTNTQTQSTPANAQTESTLTNTQTRSTTTSNPAPSHHHQTANPEVQGEDTPGSDDEGRHLVPLQAITNRAQFVCNICAHTCGSSNHLRRHHDSMHAETGVTCSRNFCEQVLPTKYMMLKHLSECYIYCNWDSCTKRFKYKKKFEAHQRAHRNLMRRYN